MNDKNQIEREEFISNSKDYWIKIHEGKTKEANSKNRGNEKIVDKWTKTGDCVEILSPLLSHSSNEVKLAAAGYLIKPEVKSQAISVLRHLIETDTSLIAPMAEAVLRVNKVSKLNLH